MDIFCCYWLGIIGEQNSWIHFLDIDSIKYGIFLLYFSVSRLSIFFFWNLDKVNQALLNLSNCDTYEKCFLTLRVYNKYFCDWNNKSKHFYLEQSIIMFFAV